MPRFSYTAINAENQKLAGSIEATNETEARGKLNNFGLAIINIKELSEKETSELSKQKKIKFKAQDTNGKNIIGTIAADSELEAYKKLKNEYNFNIFQLGNNTDMASLENLYQAEKLKKGEKETAGETIISDSTEQKKLDEQIQKTINLSEEIEKKHLHDITIDAKKNIDEKLNQLQRVRRSSNTEHIRKICKDLLEYLKTGNLFTDQEKKIDERTKIQIESEKLIEEISSTGLKKEINILESIKEWYSKRKTIKKEQKESFIDKIVEKIINIHVANKEIDPEIDARRRRLKEIKGQFFEYIGVWIKAKDSAFRKNASAQLQKLWQERKKILKDLDLIKRQRETGAERLMSEVILGFIKTFSGWILIFYLGFYFISLQLITKDFGLTKVPSLFYIYNSTFFKYFLIIFFILHAVSSLKLTFFRKNFIASIFLYPTSIAVILLIVINL